MRSKRSGGSARSKAYGLQSKGFADATRFTTADTILSRPSGRDSKSADPARGHAVRSRFNKADMLSLRLCIARSAVMFTAAAATGGFTGFNLNSILATGARTTRRFGAVGSDLPALL